MPSNRFSVDTNFLLDLAKPRDIARDALDTIRARVPGAEIIIPPATARELLHIAEKSPDTAKREQARRALFNIRGQWRFTPMLLPDLQQTYAASIAGKFLAQGIIPPDERNDARILAQSALLDCQILLSADSDLRDIDPTRLALALQSCGVANVLVLSPRDIVRRFALRR